MHKAFDAWNPQNESLTDIEKRIHDDISLDKLGERAERYLDTMGYLFPWAMPKKNSAILEVGSGVGYILEAALKRFNPSRIIGLDVVPGMIENAQKRLVRDDVNDPGIEFLLYDGVNIPIPDNSLDFIYSVACIQHIPKPYAYNLFFEMLRILKPTGFAAFQVLSFSYLPTHVAGEPFRYEVNRQVNGEEGHWHHFYSFDEMFYILSAGVGAKYIDIYDTDYELYACFGKDRDRVFFNKPLPGLTHRATIVGNTIRRANSDEPILRLDCDSACNNNMSCVEIDKIFRHKLIDLGQQMSDSKFAGILVPATADPREFEKYIYDEIFGEKASEYFEKSQYYDHHERIFRHAFEKICFTDFGSSLTILDICSGAGQSVIPLLKMFPNATVVASDLSINLLAILKQELNRFDLEDRCVSLQLNAEQLLFEDKSIDLVLGNAALHHLLNPQKSLSHCSRILKKGGIAMFFDCFELGHVFLGIIWRRILEDSRAKEIDSDLKGYMQALIQNYDQRARRVPGWQKQDDKWLFTRSWFEEQSEQLGFSRCIVYNANEHEPFILEHFFEQRTHVMLLWGRGKEDTEMPKWAWEIIRKHDKYFSTEGRYELMTEGGVILQK